MSKPDRGRIVHLAAQRERAKENIEMQKKKLENERKALELGITDKFTANVVSKEDPLMPSTAGLLTLEKIRQQKTALKSESGGSKEDDDPNGSGEKPIKIQKRILSFGDDEEEDEEPVFIPKKRLGMNPDVDTSFLPDRERELEIIRKREKLAREFKEKTEKEKNEEINVAFCYWDGSSHRRDTKMKKGATISQFLVRAIEILRKDFAEFRSVTTEGLMFVKEDLIIPHFYTFQDFIATRTMGKTGPLWQFDAVGEIRLRQDAALDIGESHPVKIVMRNWYEKNKHIYPASRWEAFVANKDYQRTTVDLNEI
ncbi:unnamed protein product [Bursaphelenchus okinawaensis]|uniref:Protein FAM50 homolog n=1 Tax=Bursaphelenchus okinawaensis TaxID=465554 RepID=A0A811K580_9BILA|nr:unnamed protein product [Bursaphelenchus okinawaensis]CAG9091585.1 unnamed protein product [Bursaphelenchus okinawaensis]